MRRIDRVLEGSIAMRHQVVPGDVLLSINGEPVLDEIDYQALTASRRLRLVLQSPDDETKELTIIKPLEAPLGLSFDDSIIGNPKTCSNQCLFCFVDQMPKGMRDTLYLKDDDWRMSLLTGNYITLTNVGEREFTRIIKRKASPLYISVHATNPALRIRLLGNKHGDQLLPRLQRLKEAGLSFHSQLVLCPGINDGPELTRSLEDLVSFAPAALSVALVPVGLTRYREGLYPMQVYTKEQAQKVLEMCYAFQQQAKQTIGTRFAYPADEFLSLAEAAIPPAEDYEGFQQIENGIGMLRKFEDELVEASKQQDKQEACAPFTALLPCGTAVAPYLSNWIKQYIVNGVQAIVSPIINEFFGETVTVTGLITGRDLIKQLSGKTADVIILVDSMLNADGTLFLDDMTPMDVEKALQIPIKIIQNDGRALYEALSTNPVTRQKPQEDETT